MPQETIEQIMERRPSAIRNSVLIYLTKFIVGLASFMFFVSGIILIEYNYLYPLLSCIVDESCYKVLVENETLIKPLTTPVGSLFVFISLLLGMIVKLSRMLLRRNSFIVDIVLWIDNLKEEESKTE